MSAFLDTEAGSTPMSPPATALRHAGSRATKRFPIFFWFGFASFHKLCSYICVQTVCSYCFLTYCLKRVKKKNTQKTKKVMDILIVKLCSVSCFNGPKLAFSMECPCCCCLNPLRMCCRVFCFPSASASFIPGALDHQDPWILLFC